MANAEEQRRLDELMNDVDFPMPGPEDLDLDFDFDFDANRVNRPGMEPSLPAREHILDQQYGAVAALATQVLSLPSPHLYCLKFFCQSGTEFLRARVFCSRRHKSNEFWMVDKAL